MDKNFDRSLFKSKLESEDILIYSSTDRLINELSDVSSSNVLSFSTIMNQSEMYDCIYVGAENQVRSGISVYHSFIVFCSYIFGLSASKAVKMFNPRVYERLGYFDVLDQGKHEFRSILVKLGVKDNDINSLLNENRSSMHTVNHPKLHVNELVAKSILSKFKISYPDIEVSQFMNDPLLVHSSFPHLIDVHSRKARDRDSLFLKQEVVGSQIC